MPIAHLLELWKGIEVEPMETEPVVEEIALDEEPVKEVARKHIYGRQRVASTPEKCGAEYKDLMSTAAGFENPRGLDVYMKLIQSY